MDKFKATYEVDDGYCGGSRPQYFQIDADDLEDEMTEAELQEFFDYAVRNHFEQNISTMKHNVDEFIEWAKDVLAERDE